MVDWHAYWIWLAVCVGIALVVAVTTGGLLWLREKERDYGRPGQAPRPR